MNVLINNEEFTASNFNSNKNTVSFNDKSIKLLKKTDKFIILNSNGKNEKVYYSYNKDKNEYSFSINGETYSLGLGLKSNRGSAQQGENIILSPMPGKIFKILKKNGDQVQQGETLLILEAMKMEHALKAGVSGIVSKLDFNISDQVEADQLLVEIIEKNND